MALLRSKASKSSPSSELSDREKALQAQIAELKDFVMHGAEREREAEVERIRTLPPPSEIQDSKRAMAFERQLSRNEIANEKRTQASNGLLLLLLILAICSIGAWIYSVVQA